MIVIVTARQDLHAIAIQGRIRERGYSECHIVECDYIAQGNNIYYTIGIADSTDRINTSEGKSVPISEARLIWLRRIRANQTLKQSLSQEEGYEIVNNDCRGALSGYLATKFKGKWISHPEATFRASDKIYQQEVARLCGFRVPKTAIAQCASDVAKFFEMCGGKIIVKTIVGVNEPFLETRSIADPATFSEEAYNASPAIYQEYIEGSKHLRLLNMKSKSLCGLIETDKLDWRPDLNVNILSWPVPNTVHDRVRKVIEQLGLEMGIVDIKITPSGELVWLEVNPQGQFIFLEPITRIPFIDEFSKYLIDEAKAVAG
jgi:glutathione synthase/RimK-type ligase-like ATP-grasp enzyme